MKKKRLVNPIKKKTLFPLSCVIKYLLYYADAIVFDIVRSSVHMYICKVIVRGLFTLN